MTDNEFQTEPWKEINGHEIIRHSSRGTVIFECRIPECRVKSNSDYGWNRTKEYLEENECPASNKNWISDFINR